MLEFGETLYAILFTILISILKAPRDDLLSYKQKAYKRLCSAGLFVFYGLQFEKNLPSYLHLGAFMI